MSGEYNWGYYIGDSENPTSSSIDLSKKDGYNNPLYYLNSVMVDRCGKTEKTQRCQVIQSERL